MTTPGGVANLPQGALTIETLASKLQDMTGNAMKSRAVERFPSIFDGSTGLSPASDITPFGILTRIWAEVNSLIANSDPNDIQGPEDLPPLLLEFIEGLPVVGEFVGLLEAILGTYDGDDDTLLTIQGIFAPIRTLVQFVGEIGGVFSLLTKGSFLQGLIPVTAGSITTDQPNLYGDAGEYPPGSIAAGSEWYVDVDSSRLDDGTGSATVECDGRYHALRSGYGPTDRIAVGAGQTFTPAEYCSHEGFSSVGGDPILLQVVPFIENGTQLPEVTVDTYAPDTADVAWPGHLMSGTYTVPAGVVEVQSRKLITDGALAGFVHFDSAKAVRASKLKQSAIDGLEDDIAAGFGQFNAIVDTIVNTFTGVTGVGHELSELENALVSIPAHFIQGIGGAVNMAESITSGWDALVSGLLGRQVSNVGAADIYNAALQTSGTVGSDQTWYFVTAGSQVVPDWADYIDAVAVGEGQPGISGAFLYFGQGGHAGKFNATTWQRTTHYTGTPTVTFVPETSGNGTPVISIPGHSISAAPGSGAQSPNGAVRGVGPGLYEYNGQTFKGGADQTSVGGAGTSPGGGGAGGGPLGLGLIPPGAGGRPGGWVRFRKNAVAGGSTGADTTAPSNPTPHFVSATNSTLTVNATGSTDS